MSTTTTAPAPAAVRDPSIRAPDAPSVVDAARAFGVMLGGPVVLLELPQFVMERKMPLEIKRRAERAA